MKSVRRLALVGVFLFVCATPLLAQNDGAFANGQFQFISAGMPAWTVSRSFGENCTCTTSLSSLGTISISGSPERIT